jgi:hypothetical protein
MADAPRRISSQFATRLLLALAPALLACGARSHKGNSAPAGKGGAAGAAGMGGTSAGEQSTAGQGSGNAGVNSGGRGASEGVGGTSRGAAGGVEGAGRSGAGGSSGGGEAGRATGGGGASAGSGGMAKAGSDDGGANDGGAAGCVLNGEPQLCNVAPDTYMGTVIDFNRFSPEGKWSSDTPDGITGRTSFYHSPGAPDAVLQQQAGSLHITVTLPPMSHAGWVFAFDKCSNALNNIGYRFPLDGELDGAGLTFSLQINADYPIDVENRKGACSFTSCDTIDPECRAPSYDIPAAGIPYTFLSVQFQQFTGGVPVSVPLTSDLYSIRGLQFELECRKDTPCVVDLTFGKLMYFSV